MKWDASEKTIAQLEKRSACAVRDVRFAPSITCELDVLLEFDPTRALTPLAHQREHGAGLRGERRRRLVRRLRERQQRLTISVPMQRGGDAATERVWATREIVCSGRLGVRVRRGHRSKPIAG